MHPPAPDPLSLLAVPVGEMAATSIIGMAPDWQRHQSSPRPRVLCHTRLHFKGTHSLYWGPGPTAPPPLSE